MISDNCSDDCDMKRQLRELYIRGNTLTRTFRRCSDDVKVQLFSMQCSCLYGAHLWSKYASCSFNRVRTAYNDIFRQLMNMRRGESISAAFVSKNVHSLQILIRKAVFSFIERCTKSCNTIVKTIVSSVFFLYGSTILKTWRKCLLL